MKSVAILLCIYFKKIIISKSCKGLAHATGVHERNTVPYARFALKKRHGFCAKARQKKHAKAQIRHTLGTVKARFKYC